MRLIGFVTDHWEASGGMHDALEEDGNIMLFNSEAECVEYVRTTPIFCSSSISNPDNLEIWDMDTLRVVGKYEADREYEKGVMTTLKYRKVEP